MDESVLLAINGTTWDPSKRETYPVRVQLNNSLGSISQARILKWVDISFFRGSS